MQTADEVIETIKTYDLEVHRKAKEAGIESPYLVRVIEESKKFVGAWL